MKSRKVSQSVASLFFDLFGGKGPNFPFEQSEKGSPLLSERTVPTDLMTWTSFAMMLGLTSNELAELLTIFDGPTKTLFSRYSETSKALGFTSIKRYGERAFRIAEQLLEMAGIQSQACGEPDAYQYIIRIPHYCDLPKKPDGQFTIFKVLVNQPHAGALAFQYCKVISISPNAIPHLPKQAEPRRVSYDH